MSGDSNQGSSASKEELRWVKKRRRKEVQKKKKKKKDRREVELIANSRQCSFNSTQMPIAHSHQRSRMGFMPPLITTNLLLGSDILHQINEVAEDEFDDGGSIASDNDCLWVFGLNPIRFGSITVPNLNISPNKSNSGVVNTQLQ